MKNLEESFRFNQIKSDWQIDNDNSMQIALIEQKLKQPDQIEKPERIVLGNKYYCTG